MNTQGEGGNVGYDLFDLGLLDGGREKPFDSLVNLVAETLDTPVALLTIIDDLHARQQFKAQVGLAEPWRSQMQTPFTHSFCKIVRDTGQVLVVGDARKDARVAGNMAIEDLRVESYLGLPVHCPANEAVGALCAIDHAPRNWTEREVSLMKSFAELATNMIMLRAALETIKIIQGTITSRSM